MPITSPRSDTKPRTSARTSPGRVIMDPPSVPTYPADSSNGTPQVRADHTPGDPEPEAASRSPLEGRCPMRISSQGVMAAYATPKRREKGVVAKTPHPVPEPQRRPLAQRPRSTP